MTNDSQLPRSAATAVRAALGQQALLGVATIPPALSEDFGSFQERVPGVFFFLGVSSAARGTRGMPHSADYVADERAIAVGVTAMAAAVVGRLNEGSR